MIKRIPEVFEAECDHCGAIEEAASVDQLARNGWLCRTSGGLPLSVWCGLERPRTGRQVFCPGCRATELNLSHDPECYSCKGTGKITGFGFTGSRCPCTRCYYTTDDCTDIATHYDEGRPCCDGCAVECD